MLAGLLVACCLSSPALGQVLTTIVVDGDTADWSAVLAEPLQTAQDGPAGGLPDRDAPVPSTGRDLTAFAWTHDASHLYFYVARVASASNVQRFWFYVDVDEDGLQESGEPVVGVSWWGANRRTLVAVYAYAADSPGGDPLGDPSGFADGWTLPGTVTPVRTLEDVRGGAASGTEMESRVAWSDLGIAAGTPVRFHVSSSNGTNVPQQIHDNMGGPGGAVGTTRLAPGITLLKAVSDTESPPGAILTYTVTYTSDGAVPARAVVLLDPVPPEVEYVAGSATGAGTAIEFSHDGGATFDGSDVAPVTHIRWSLTAPLAPGDGGTVSFRARIR